MRFVVLVAITTYNCGQMSWRQGLAQDRVCCAFVMIHTESLLPWLYESA
jgi:hypothetical protein